METTKICAVWLIICFGCEDMVRSSSVHTPLESRTQDTTSGQAHPGLHNLDNVRLERFHF